MAPLALEQICEQELSTSRQGALGLQDCPGKAAGVATGTFCVGGSAGFALQVHFRRLIPYCLRSILLVPAALAIGSALTMHKHTLESCERRLYPNKHKFNFNKG